MTCRVVDQQEVIPKYLNGQLDSAAQDDFEVHILECPECQDAVELFQRVREQLEERAHEIRSYDGARRNLWWSWATVAACCVIAVAIGIRQVGLRKGVGPQAIQKQVSAPQASSAVQTTGAGAGSSPGVPAGKQVGGTGSSNPQIAADAPRGTALPPGKGESARTQVATATDKNAQSPHPNDVNTTLTPEQSKVETAGSAGNLMPDKGTSANPTVARNATSPGEPLAAGVAQLAAVRPLPYSFSGLAASQPTGGGSTRESHSLTTAVSGTAGTPQPGTNGFSTGQDYFRDGMTAYVDRHYETASDLLAQAVRLDPEIGEANLYLGICALLRDKPNDAISPLQSASSQKKPAIAQAAHFYLAKAYLKLGRSADAEAELHAAAELSGRLAGEAKAVLQRLQALQHPNTNQ